MTNPTNPSEALEPVKVELLPCPFCGNDGSGPIEVALHVAHSECDWRPAYDSYCVQCDKCTATMGYSDSEEDAIAAWNTRTPSDDLIEVLDGWQDIATAPKDGTEVLVWRDHTGIILARYTSAAEFLTEAELAEWDEASAYKEDWFAADFVQGSRLESDCAPTHWRPLPAPPTPLSKHTGEY